MAADLSDFLRTHLKLMNMKADSQRPFSLTQAPFLCFNSALPKRCTQERGRDAGSRVRGVRDAHVDNRTGDADSADREPDSAPRCCPESGNRILGLFVPPVTRCHCDRCCTRCVPYGQLGSDREKGLFYKTQIVTRSQIKYCCL